MKKYLMASFACQVLVALSFCSCSDSDPEDGGTSSLLVLTPEEYASIAYDNPGEISEEKALDIVNSFAKDCETRTTSAKPSVIQKVYWNMETGTTRAFLDEEFKVPIYEIALNNGTDGGFALVSADERNPCVVAYSPKGELKDSASCYGMSMMLQNTKSVMCNDFKWFDYIKKRYRDETLSKLRKHFGTEDVSFEKIKDKITISDGYSRSTGVTNPSTGILLDSIANQVYVTWGQDDPYNSLLDYAPNPRADNGRNLVGCVGVAMAEIVAHYEALDKAYGCQLHWDQLKRRKQITTGNELINQVANLCKHVAVGVKTVWDNEGNGDSNMKKAYDYLNSLGIIFETGKNYNGYDMNTTSIVASLREYCPVFATGISDKGGGHCWILDGFQFRSRTTIAREYIKNNDTYIHANFGWIGKYDGYYLVDRGTTNLTFETLQNSYTKDIRIYTYIERK